MTATPAWPPESAPRLFVDHALSEGAEVVLDSAQANYLLNVMRLKAGDAVRCFDDRTGEWAAEIASAGKRDARLRMVAHLREREPVPDLWLVAAPIKRQRDRLDGGEGLRARRRRASCRCSPGGAWSTGSTSNGCART